jgi:hypothetical protein
MDTTMMGTIIMMGITITTIRSQQGPAPAGLFFSASPPITGGGGAFRPG